MKKKIFTFFLALVASAGIMFASDIQVDGIWYNFDSSTQTATVTYQGSSYTDYSGSVVIPASVTYLNVTYSVTSIGKNAFRSCRSLTSVTIPNSVTSIGERAFDGCSGLTKVNIMDIAAWCNIAFSDSGSNPLSIAKHLYVNDEEVTELVIPDSVTSIGEHVFENCACLTSVTIPNSVTSIGSSAFYNCSGLTSVSIPNSVTSIGYYAFSGCSGLTSVTIPNSVTSIRTWAFLRCDGLTSVIVENGNTIYDSRDNCNAIIETATNKLIAGFKNSTIPNSVTGIGDYAFAAYSGLSSIEIPNSVTSIGADVFYNCSGLTSVTNYASTPQNINSDVFYNVNKSTCTLYVPAGSVDAYKAAKGWKDFENIVGVDVPGEDPVETIPGDYSIYYVDKENQELSDEVVTLHVPVAPSITGFTFLKWVVVGGDLVDTITIQAVYEANEPSSAPAVYTNPANPAQKLIRNGNVYILTEDKTYTITGLQVK